VTRISFALQSNLASVVINREEVMTMADMHEGELELELEDEYHEGELEGEEESGLEGEGWLGAIGNVVGSLLGEGEEEFEEEFEEEGSLEGEGEEEFEEETFLEGELEDESSLKGEGEEEFEGESSLASEDEGELFFGKIGRFLKKAAPILRKVAKVAIPLVGTAIAGPAGGAIGSLASKALGEGEFEAEGEYEFEGEGEREMAHEIASHQLTHNEAVAEMMADAASREIHEGEAEAMAGAATVTVISPADRRALRRILPHLVRGTAILTRILRRRRVTRPVVRVVPTIMRRAVKDLKRQAAKGIPITRRRAARAAVKQVRRVLSSPRACAAAITRNVKVSRAYKRPRRRVRGRLQRRRRAMR
jgi:hypothetical protein